MDRKKTRAPKKQNGFYPLLACILLMVTLTGFCLHLSGGGSVARAWKKTSEALAKKEEATLFLLSAVKEGSLSARGKDLSVSYQAALPRALSLSVKDQGAEIGLFAQGDRLTLHSPTLLEGAYDAPRSGSATAFSQSVLNGEAVKEEHAALFRILLALSDPALWEEDAEEGLSALWKKADPKMNKIPLKVRDMGTVGGTAYEYTVDSHGLVNALNEGMSLGKKEAFRNGIRARAAALLAFCGKDFTPEDEKALFDFLDRKGEAFNTFSQLVGKSDSKLELGVIVNRKGFVSHFGVSWNLGEYQGEIAVLLEGKNGTPSLEEASLSVKKGEKEILRFSAKFQVTDDSDVALIREATFSLFDESGYLSDPEAPEKTATLRYSWGKEKGDLGLKLITPEKEINLRGTLEEWKKGNRLVFRLKR
ncbi:MAG: hypothetical protein IKD18_06300, partial [Clostridia bacterium]|nr:hypothetical protein [Clostridia bacterium]